MPTKEESRRGVVRYRTIRLKGGRYAHVAIVRKRGKRGGHSVMGKVRTIKKRR